LVILQHVDLRLPLSHTLAASWLPSWLLNALVGNGYEAVFVFFVISGFVITSTSLARWGSLGSIDVAAFYARRAARILPCLLLLVLVLSVLDLAGAANYVIDNPKQSLARAILAALGLHMNLYEAITGYLPASWDVLWSLSIEEVFYLAFPMVCLLLGRSRLLIPALLILAWSLPELRSALKHNEIWREKAYLPGMAAIATGVLAALAAARWRPLRPLTPLLLLSLGTLCLAAVFCCDEIIWRLLHNGNMLLLTLSAAALIVALHWRQTTGLTLPMRCFAWLRSFGRLSYEIYLCHMFAVWMIVDLVRWLGMGEAWQWLFYLAALVFSWLLGWCVARCISIPAERGVLRRGRMLSG
jgi:peptidoglycan/LPS O-acetylase OafA/YrhL